MLTDKDSNPNAQGHDRTNGSVHPSSDVGGERAAVERTEGGPLTVASMTGELRQLGVVPGMVLLVHSSMSRLGWVCGGPQAVVLAFEQALGPEGTLVMPTFSTGLSDPEAWRSPAVPEDWWDVIREHMPAYDPDLTPTRAMGSVPECFRKQRDVIRSPHPTVSFAARGPLAERIVGRHPIRQSLGDPSPLARLYEVGASVLLLGVGHANNTSLHLADYRADYEHGTMEMGSVVLEDGRRSWIRWRDLELSDEDFCELGASFEAAHPGSVSRREVGRAEAILLEQRRMVDFAARWITRHRADRG